MLFTGELFRKELARAGGPSMVGKRLLQKARKRRREDAPSRAKPKGHSRHQILAMRGRAAEVGCPTSLRVRAKTFYRTSISPEPLRRSRLKPPPPRTLPRTSCRFCVPSTVTGTPRLMELELECA